MPVIFRASGCRRSGVNSSYRSINLQTDEGVLNLAGVLLFAERPEWIKPQFVIKAIRYPGNTIHVSEYFDTEGTFAVSRGLGSGIKWALEDWSEIDFTDDRDGWPVHGHGSPKGIGRSGGI